MRKIFSYSSLAFEKISYLGTKDYSEVLANNMEGENAILIPKDF